jgi:hypothetical protein
MYIHEMTLQKAKEKLYMLGSSRKRKDHSGAGLNAGAIASGYSNAEAAKKAQRELMAKRDKAEKAAEREDIEYIKGNSPNSPEQNPRNLVAEGQALPYSYQDNVMTAKDAQRAQELSDLAEETRMGGRYTPKGLQMTEVNAAKNADDRLKARAMIGQQLGMRMY